MTFFLDINVPFSFAEYLKQEGHKANLGAEIGFHGKTDWDICEFAKQNNAIIGTHDLDFGELLAVSGNAIPSVIIFRIQPLSKKLIKSTFRKAWPKAKNVLKQGAILVLEKDKYRIRKLPIKK